MLTTEDAFLTQMSLVSRKLKSEAQKRLLEHGVHAGQQFILACLWEQDGLTPGEIATRVQVEKPTITRATQRMAMADLIRTEADRRDGRRTRVWLTPKGDRLRQQIPVVLQELQAEALAPLSPDERLLLITLLSRVSRGMESSTSQGGDPPAAPVRTLAARRHAASHDR